MALLVELPRLRRQTCQTWQPHVIVYIYWSIDDYSPVLLQYLEPNSFCAILPVSNYWPHPGNHFRWLISAGKMESCYVILPLNLFEKKGHIKFGNKFSLNNCGIPSTLGPDDLHCEYLPLIFSLVKRSFFGYAVIRTLRFLINSPNASAQNLLPHKCAHCFAVKPRIGSFSNGEASVQKNKNKLSTRTIQFRGSQIFKRETNNHN